MLVDSPLPPSRSRRATWTFALSLAATVSGALAALITTPLLLLYLGDERVGAYRVAAEWIAYLALLDFGITGALQVAFAKALGTGNRAGVSAAVRAGARAGLILAVATALCGLGLAVAGPYMLRDMSPEVGEELRLGLLLALVAVLWAPFIAFRPLAEAGQRGYVVQIAMIIQCWLTAGLVIGLAAAGAGLPGQFLAVAIGNGVAVLILFWDGLRRYPEILAAAAPAVALPVAFSGSMFAFNLLSRIGLHSDSIIVGLTLGPTAVVAFTVTQRLLLLADAQVMALGSASWGALAELHHQGQTERFNKRLTQLTRWTGVFGFTLLVPIAAASRPVRRTLGRRRAIRRRSAGDRDCNIRLGSHGCSALGLAAHHDGSRARRTADLRGRHSAKRRDEHPRIALAWSSGARTRVGNRDRNSLDVVAPLALASRVRDAVAPTRERRRRSGAARITARVRCCMSSRPSFP